LFNFYPQFVDLLNGLGEISGVYGSGSGLGEVPAKSIDGSPIKGRGFGGSFGEVNAKLGGSQPRMIMPGYAGSSHQGVLVQALQLRGVKRSGMLSWPSQAVFILLALCLTILIVRNSGHIVSCSPSGLDVKQ